MSVVPDAVENPNQFVEVPSPNDRFVSDVLPSTVNVEVTVDDAPINPPSKYNSFVVVAPLLEICCNVAVVAAVPGQLVPVDRQTVWLFTNSWVVETTVAKKFVDVTFVNVALVAVSVPSVVAPITVNVDVTVDELPMNPPYNWSVVVANEPRALTEASVSLEPGQFVPVDRQTC